MQQCAKHAGVAKFRIRSDGGDADAARADLAQEAKGEPPALLEHDRGRDAGARLSNIARREPLVFA
jgi:hypothetical protein